MDPAKRSLSLDIFRFAALALVMMRHWRVCPERLSPLWHRISVVLQQGGWVGVDIFFVLSGFLVGGLLLRGVKRSGSVSPGRFYLRRGFKIYPLLWLSLPLVWWMKSAYGLRPSGGQLSADLFFYASYVRGLLGVGWSLAVEEHFYLLLPGVLWLTLRGVSNDDARWRRLTIVVASWTLGSIVLRAASYGTPDSFDFSEQFTCTHLRLDGLFFGVWLAAAFHLRRTVFLGWIARYRRWLLPAFVAGLLPPYLLPLESWYILVPGFTVQYLAAGAGLCWALTWTPRIHLLNRGLAALGRQSYATYLLHQCISIAGTGLLWEKTGWAFSWSGYLAVYFGASFSLGWLLTRFIEQPLLAWRDRRFPATVTAPRAHSVSPASTGSRTTGDQRGVSVSRSQSHRTLSERA